MLKRKCSSEDGQDIAAGNKKRKLTPDARTLATDILEARANDDYTVGWICATSTEYVAGQEFLDSEHEAPGYVSQNDSNDYTLGKIGKHNVVIAVLPDGEYGTASATSVATNMLHSFPNIRIGLMVGIGGGAPSGKHDIRLGDIVVSAPRDAEGGVFQYDFGKTIQGQAFQHTRYLNQPPTLLRTAVSGIKAQHERRGHQLEETINIILKNNPRLRKKYQRPEPSADRLFKAEVTHDSSCTAVCVDDASNLIWRPERTEGEDNLTIHYGLIASANQLMKDALVRDRLAAEKDVLCFEMEAAGLMNQFPCLVVRGICDYSDSHKNKDWQGYAAMAAAAYAKDLLCRIPPNKVEAEKRIGDILSDVQKRVIDLSEDVEVNKALLYLARADQISSTIREWLKAPDATINYNEACKKWHPGTGLWFVKGYSFSAWLTNPNSFLWLNGFAGCGKSVLCSTAIRFAYRHRRSDSRIGIAFFFFTFNDDSKQDTSAMLRALVLQLSNQLNSNHELSRLHKSYRNAMPPDQALMDCLHQLVRAFDDVYILLDALDESPQDKHRRGDMLRTLADLRKWSEPGLHLLVTSRDEPDIRRRLCASRDETILMKNDSVNDDIAAFISNHLKHNEQLEQWREYYDKIENALTKGAKGVFRWVECQFKALESCPECEDLLDQLLHSLPQSLDETYERMLSNIAPAFVDYARRMLTLLCCARRPLTLPELIDGIAVELGDPPKFNPKRKLRSVDAVHRVCPGFIEVDVDPRHSQATVRIAHFSVQEYLESGRICHPEVNKFSVRLREAHAEIACICLTYLLEPALSGGSTKEYPLALYAARSWHEHYRVGDKTFHQVEFQALRLFQSTEGAFETWINVWDVDMWGSKRSGNMPLPVYYASLLGLDSVLTKLLGEKPSSGTFLGLNSSEVSDLVNIKGGWYGNALQAASYGGHNKAVRLLLEKGADVNAQGGYFGNALQAASRGGYDKVVRLLLEKGADVNAQDGYFGNALQAASYGGQDKVVRLLVKDADINVQGGWYGNALQAASAGGHESVSRLLIADGAKVNAQGGGCTRFELTEVMEDLNQAVEIADVAMEATPIDHPDRASRLDNLGTWLGRRFERTSSMDDLNRAVDIASAAVNATPQDHPDRAGRLNNLGKLLGKRFERTGSIDDLNRAVSLVIEAVDAMPQDYPNRSSYLNNLGMLLSKRFERTGSMDDLNYAIDAVKMAVDATPRDYFDRAGRVNSFGTLLGRRFERTGSMDDLNRAIDIVKIAVNSTPQDHFNRAGRLNSLGTWLGRRFERTGSIDDLNYAVEITDMAVWGTHLDHPDRAGWFSYLGIWLGRRFERMGMIKDLFRAVEVANLAVWATPFDHLSRASRLDNLGNLLGIQFKETGWIDDLNRAVDIAGIAVDTTPKDHPDRASRLNNLGSLLVKRFKRSCLMDEPQQAVKVAGMAWKLELLEYPDKSDWIDIPRNLPDACSRQPDLIDDLNRALSSYKEGWNCHSAPPFDRIRLAWKAARILNEQLNWKESSQLLQEALNLLPIISSRSLKHTDKEYMLAEFAGLASTAAATALNAGKDVFHALQLLELGRDVIASPLMDMRGDISDLKQNHPSLADEFIFLRDVLDLPTDRSNLPISNDDISWWESHVKRRREAEQKFGELVMKIRTQRGFNRFLRPLAADELMAAADPGPIIVVNLSLYRCDAFLVERDRIRALELCGPALEEVLKRALDLRLSGTGVDIAPLLERLWDDVARPSLDALGFKNPISDNNWPRVWWIPTGLLGQLPLHAAGYHTSGRSETVLDRVMSSYASSIKALLYGRRHHRRPANPHADYALLVAMRETPDLPILPFAEMEVEMLHGLCPSLQLRPVTPIPRKDDVLKYLQTCSIFHFAGHGQSNLAEPSRSCLLLEDWKTNPLSVGDLRDQSLQENAPFLAYLGACSTGANKTVLLADEGIHLVSAFQLAGFRHVVGMLWEVEDRHCRDVAMGFYKTLRDEGMKDAAVCLGLHRAVRALRDKETRDIARMHSRTQVLEIVQGIVRPCWVPYAHFGA
ncbi:hypothetical protein HD806DRAFT_488009 [Xylariaceae sp. AK1471]|nr:hypothetical protein HD806DRAFT_488009 [Xylariaceae sp. AK1471]